MQATANAAALAIFAYQNVNIAILAPVNTAPKLIIYTSNNPESQYIMAQKELKNSSNYSTTLLLLANTSKKRFSTYESMISIKFR